MISPLRLTVLSPVKTLLDVADVAWLQVRLADGAGLGIYPGHAPLIAETISAPLRYATAEGEQQLELAAGILHITLERVWLLTAGATAELAPSASEADSELARFDRLAGALLTTLDAAPAPEAAGD